jgi:ribose transport system permease protein
LAATSYRKNVSSIFRSPGRTKMTANVSVLQKPDEGDLVRSADLRRFLRALLPAISLALVLAAIGWLNPRVISYFGFTLMLNYAVPIALATLAQMFAMTCNDIDLSIGAFVGFVCCVAATYLNESPAIGALILSTCVLVYAGLGTLIHWRNLPSIVVTLGMSFVWQGLAILLLPKPGGKAPDWLQAIMGFKPPVVPLPILAAILVAAIAWAGLMRTSYGAILRGVGGNATAVRRAGWSLLVAKTTLFGLSGLFGVLSGLALVGITRSADAHLGDGYTLLSIAGVILGGGEFVGGLVSPIGAVIGALTLTLASTQLLGFMRIPADWQVGANGAILIIVLAARVLISQRGRTR